MKTTHISLIGVLLIMMMIPIGTSGADTFTTELVEPVLVIGGEQGSKPSQFDEPDSIFVSPIDGRIFAGDTVNLRVQVFSSDGTYLTEFTGFTPLSVNSNNEVQGIGELSDGTIVVVEKAGNLTFFDRETGDIKHVTQLAKETSASSIDTQGLAVNPANDYIYVSNQPLEMMYVIAPNGTFVDEWSIGKFSTPENIVVDPARERIYVSAEGQSSIYIFHMNGTFMSSFGKGVASFNYEGLALDPYGHILAMDEGGDTAGTAKSSRVVIFDPDNFTALYAFGDLKSGTQPGQFISPDGLSYDSYANRVFVADQGNYRIQAFDYPSILKSARIVDDTEAPTITSTSSTYTIGESETSGFSLEWQVSDNEPFSMTYSITVDGSEVTGGRVGTDGKISFSPELTAAGSYTIVLSVTDGFGNIGTDEVKVTVTASTSSDTTAGTSADTNTTSAKTNFTPMLIPTVVTAVILRKKSRTKVY